MQVVTRLRWLLRIVVFGIFAGVIALGLCALGYAAETEAPAVAPTPTPPLPLNQFADTFTAEILDPTLWLVTRKK